MMEISAQVRLIPLRQGRLAPANDLTAHVFQKYGLKVESSIEGTLISGDDALLFGALRKAFRLPARQGNAMMTVTFSHACLEPGASEEPVVYRAIGRVESAFQETTPQHAMHSAESRIVLDPALAEGLEGLEPGQQVLVLFYFHRSQGFDLLQHPRGDRTRPQRGVFALRSPRRPNLIGVTIVDLLAME